MSDDLPSHLRSFIRPLETAEVLAPNPPGVRFCTSLVATTSRSSPQEGDRSTSVVSPPVPPTDDDRTFVLDIARARGARLDPSRVYGWNWIRRTADSLEPHRTRIVAMRAEGLTPAAIDLALDGHQTDPAPAPTPGPAAPAPWTPTVVPDPMRLTSVEAAALTDPDSAAGDDPIHTTLRRCLSIAERMRDSRHDLERAVHDLAQIMGILGNPPPPTCEILVGEPVDRTSDFGGLLPRPYRVCRPVVDFVYTRERLPTETEREEYRRYGVWQRRVRVLP